MVGTSRHPSFEVVGAFGLRHLPAGSSRSQAESSSLALRTNRSPRVAPHPASRRRSYLRVREAKPPLDGDFHPADSNTITGALATGLQACEISQAWRPVATKTMTSYSKSSCRAGGSVGRALQEHAHAAEFVVTLIEQAIVFFQSQFANAFHDVGLQSRGHRPRLAMGPAERFGQYFVDHAQTLQVGRRELECVRRSRLGFVGRCLSRVSRRTPPD